MTAHADRAHAVLSASGAHRWIACPPSARLEQQFPDTTSGAAKEGTLAHEIAEVKALRYIGKITKQTGTRRMNKLKKEELYDPEMDRYTDEYVDAIKAAALRFKHLPYVALEQRLDLTQWIPEGFGTADCIMIGDEVLQVMDFKYGKGVPVSPEENPQMRLYALGAYAMYGLLYDIRTVRMTIVQPRIDNTETWEEPLEDLLAFGDHVKKIAAVAMEGGGEFSPGESQCRFCRARAKCRARAEENVRLAFMTDKKPDLLSNDEIGEYLRQGEDVARWLADLKDHALSECLAGREVNGWKAVEGRGSRAWTDADKAFRVLIGSGIDESILYKREPLTLAQTEKTIGKKAFEDLVGQYVEKKPGKPALVRESDKRPAITNRISAADAFGD